MTRPAHVQALLDDITARFSSGFREGPAGWRTVGREAEYPVVMSDGTAAEVAALWAPLRDLCAQQGIDLALKKEGDLIVALVGERFTYFSEVGRGTIEVLTGPRQDLWQIAEDHEFAMAILLRACRALGFSVLGYGIQPLTPATGRFMLPKVRYGVLLASIGDPWLWFTLTASDQVHASIARDEVVPLSNIANMLAPVTVGLCANSPVFGGLPSGFMSSREGKMGEIHAGDHRHGMTRDRLADLPALVEDLARHPCLMEIRHIDGQDHHVIADGPFTSWLEQHGQTWQQSGRQDPFTAFLLHEHYIWNSARARSNHGTLEMRAACQQPWTEPDCSGRSHHMAASALGVAMVAAGAEIQAWFDDCLGAHAWPTMRAWHHRVLREGLAAPEPVEGLYDAVLTRCEQALADRGRGEEELLRPARHRLETRQNPAQRALAAFEEDGVDGLVAAARIAG
ncbi:MAG: hypothetical protein H6742_14910 [Alphaproteobacteria bacterium]|nr:hypothetical protein [Alphaproteobacteria bacterium]